MCYVREEIWHVYTDADMNIFYQYGIVEMYNGRVVNLFCLIQHAGDVRYLLPNLGEGLNDRLSMAT